MSQRLCVGPTDETRFDCVVDSMDNAEEKLITEWLSLIGNSYVGPWKIWVKDDDLWKDVKPIVADIFSTLKHEYPDCVSVFH